MGELWYPDAVRHDMRPVMHDPNGATPWAQGKPHIIVNHFTGNLHGDTTWPGAGRFQAEGIGSQFGIRQDGTVCQYCPAEFPTWHAIGMSHHGEGIEYDGNPMVVGGASAPMTVAQMRAGAALNAWLCKTFGIPVVRAPGAEYTSGIKVHADGMSDGGKLWDWHHHWDSVWKATGDAIAKYDIPVAALDRQPWTSTQFIAAVKANLKPPPPPFPGRNLEYTPPHFMQGADVKRWKEELQRRSKWNPNWPVVDDTDIFGKGADGATRGFQANNGLKVDGIVGPITWAEAFD